MNPWILAARPKTLTAGVIPVIVGSALAAHTGKFSWLIFFAALVGALAIQIATNYINDGADFLRGADTEERIGPKRMAQSGLITPKQLFIGAGFFLLLALVAGTILIAHAGWPMLWIGIASIACAAAYTAGPFPLAYYGLGDIFVFIFFGVVAVCGTYFAQTLRLEFFVVLASIMIGLQGVALIVVNNTRDISTDKKVGKKTMSVRIGARASKIYYSAIVLLPFVLLCFFALNFSWKYLIPLACLPIAVFNSQKMFRASIGQEFNVLLASTAKLQLFFGALLSIAALL